MDRQFILLLGIVLVVSSLCSGNGEIRTACATTKFNSPLKLDCGDTFDKRGIIAVRRIYFGGEGNCEKPDTDWNCLVDATELNIASIQNIYSGNSRPNHFVTVYPVILTQCHPVRYSQVVYVGYSCHDEQTFHDMCEPASLKSKEAMNFVSPTYVEVSNLNVPIPGPVPPSACICSISVPTGFVMRVTVLVLDIPCSAETFVNGSLVAYQDVWEMMQYRQGVCGRTTPYSVTVDRKWTFIYIRHTQKKSTRLGLWFVVEGISNGSNSKYIRTRAECRTIPFPEESTATTAGSPQENVHSEGNSSNTGVIMGAVAGVGVVIIALLFVVCVVVMKRRANRNSQPNKLANEVADLAPIVPPRNQSTFLSDKSPDVPRAYYITQPDNDLIYAVPKDVIGDYSAQTNPAVYYVELVGDEGDMGSPPMTTTLSSDSTAACVPGNITIQQPLDKGNSVLYAHLSGKYAPVTETSTDYDKLSTR